MYRERVLGVLFKTEVTSGTDSIPTGAADAVRLANVPTVEYGYLESGNRDDVVIPQLGRIGRAAPAGNFGRLTVRLEVRGAAAVYSSSVKPEPHALFLCSGLDAQLVTTAGVEAYNYFSVDVAIATGTCYVYTANKLIKLVGCVVNWDLAATALQRGFLDFTITGRVTSVTEAAVPALTFQSSSPPLFHSSTTVIGTYSSGAASDPLVVRSAALHLGNTLTERPSAGATDGLIGWTITDRIPRQDMVVEVPLLTSFDAFAQSKAVGANNPTSSWQIGTVQYNRVKIATGQWALEAPGDGADHAIKTWNLTGNLVQGTAPTLGREFVLTYD